MFLRKQVFFFQFLLKYWYLLLLKDQLIIVLCIHIPTPHSSPEQPPQISPGSLPPISLLSPWQAKLCSQDYQILLTSLLLFPYYVSINPSLYASICSLLLRKGLFLDLSESKDTGWGAVLSWYSGLTSGSALRNYSWLWLWDLMGCWGSNSCSLWLQLAWLWKDKELAHSLQIWKQRFF